MGLRVVKPQANQLCDKEEKEATQEAQSYEDVDAANAQALDDGPPWATD